MFKVDLNCDLGESFGVYRLGRDEEILAHVTSVNIACGFHAGDPSVMRKTVREALKAGAAIGAHPGLPDMEGFGRRNMDISPTEACDMVTYQIGALDAFLRQEGGTLHHVKPHGALYNMASVQRPLADAIVKAVQQFDRNLILYGLAGSELIRAGKAAGLQTAAEVFADRTYQDDGSLTPRRLPGAVIAESGKAVNQVLRMVKEGKVMTLSGGCLAIQADTVCIHGDGEFAVSFASELRTRLQQEGVTIQSIHRNAHQRG